jgi:hypothetical protein
MNSQESLQKLTNQLSRWDTRRRTADMLIWVPRGLLAGLMIAVAIAAVARFRPLLTNQELLYVVGGLAAISLLVSLVALLLQRRSTLEKARFADRRFSLQERTTTAIEIQSGRLETLPALAEQQLNDTMRAVESVNVRDRLPLRPDWRDLSVVLLALALLTAAILLPNPQVDTLLQQRAIDKAIADQIESLESLADEIRENPDLTEEQQEELLEPIESAIEELEEGDISQEEAVAVLSETEAELRDLAAENSNEGLQQALQDAGQPLAENENSQTLGEALQSGNLSQAGTAASQLADSLDTLSPDEQAQLGQDLAETAAALQEVDPELAAQLAQAAQALQNGDVEAAQQALQEAGATLQERAQEQAAAQQAAAAAGELNEGRSEVAQAGQGEQQGQQGQQGQGEGQGQQGQQGQSEGEGQGEGQGQGQGQGQEQGSQDGQPGGPSQGGGHVEDVYVPEYVDLTGEEGEEIELPAECIANPEDCGSLLNENATEFGDEDSVVPYDQVFGDYRDAAYTALDEGYVPLGLKGFIRDYFSLLEP